MRCLGITQRVDYQYKTLERRDALDQRWQLLADALGFMLIPLPNMKTDSAKDYIMALELDALVLSGGNSLSYVEPEAADAAAERDAFETLAIQYASKCGIPILGVCRGMQMLNHYFGGSLIKVSGHVSCTHGLNIAENFSGLVATPVNSYHNWAIAESGLGEDLQPIAFDETGNVEAFTHRSQKIAGIMWHPERELPHRPSDLKLLECFLS